MSRPGPLGPKGPLHKAGKLSGKLSPPVMLVHGDFESRPPHCKPKVEDQNISIPGLGDPRGNSGIRMQKNRTTRTEKSSKQHLLSVRHIFATSFLKKQKESNAFFAFQSLEKRDTPDGRKYLFPFPSIHLNSFHLKNMKSLQFN